MHFIAIDFSLNSPGICVYSATTESYTFISYLKAKSGTKKEQKLQEDFSALKDSMLKEQPDFKSQEAEYSSVEFAKIKRYITTSEDILTMVADVIDPSDECIFAFEGTSFGSKMGTNNIIDMAAGAAILKLKILESFNVKLIETVAPSTIKKHAGKGNMNKVMLWEKFITNSIGDKYIENSETFKFCQSEIGEVTKIPKPFDDLVDAYFLNHYLRSISTTEA
jgi:hypothetical protein